MPTSSTPALPQWILEAQVLGYSTAHRVLPDETRLYGTESLYGDWNGSVLLLAKDFAPSRILHERMAVRHPRPYSHEPELGTNKRLIRFAGNLARSDDPANCGMLYGSALANLLRDDGNFSGSLPNRPQAMKHGVDVLRFVVERMPNLSTIVCMGEEAFEVTAAVLEVPVRWRDRGEMSGPLRAGTLAISVVPHPAARLSYAQHEAAWARVEAPSRP